MKTKIYVFLMVLTLLATAACSPTDASQAGVNSTAQVSQPEASATSTGQSLSAPAETPATSSTANLPEWSDLETHEADAPPICWFFAEKLVSMDGTACRPLRNSLWS